LSARHRRFAYFTPESHGRGVLLQAEGGDTFILPHRRGGESSDLNRVFMCMALVMKDGDWEVVRAALAQHDAGRTGKRKAPKFTPIEVGQILGGGFEETYGRLGKKVERERAWLRHRYTILRSWIGTDGLRSFTDATDRARADWVEKNILGKKIKAMRERTR